MAITWLRSMTSWPKLVSKVSPRSRRDEELEAQYQTLVTMHSTGANKSLVFSKIWPWYLPISLTIIIILLLVIAIGPTELAQQKSSNTDSCNLFPSEFFDAAHIAPAAKYQDVIFTSPTWGSGSEYDGPTTYDGPPTGKSNLMWHELMDVGIVALTPEQSSSLQLPTAPASAADDTPLVQLDVFHQLHCLNAIRKFVFTMGSKSQSDYTKGLVHINHCIDQIRQSLMCHADISIIYHVPRPMTERTPQLPTWKANFSAPHTCRDFWAIHEWAKQYNTSGFEIERWNNEEFL